jgi:hypothetical protein
MGEDSPDDSSDTSSLLTQSRIHVHIPKNWNDIRINGQPIELAYSETLSFYDEISEDES